MRNVQKKILKRAKTVRRPVKKAVKQGERKFRFGYLVGLGALVVLRKRWRAKRSGRALRNKQGVGPAHIKGVPRAEERGMKHRRKEPATP